MLRKPLLFFCNADCTNNNNHFQTLLALTAIFIIHQCVHFWGVSTAQPGAERPGNLQFSNHEVVSVRKRQGNLNNVRICNGRFSQLLANVSGVLAVRCLENNSGHIRPPAGGHNFNISVEITKHISSRDSTDTNGGITNFSRSMD
jgi:hypothetical protein